MAKDPAFLFYPGDWLGGTITFSRAQKGAYMDLLMAQFNQVALTIEDIKQILGSDFDMWDAKIKDKFEYEADGKLFFNRKLRDEIIKRKEFTIGRRKNLEGLHVEKEIKPSPAASPLPPARREVPLNPYIKFLEWFGAYYVEMTKQPFNRQEKHFAIVKRLIDKHGGDMVIEKTKLLARACRDCSLWFTKDGFADFTVEKLSQQWNSLLPQERLTPEEISNQKIQEGLKKRREQNVAAVSSPI